MYDSQAAQQRLAAMSADELLMHLALQGAGWPAVGAVMSRLVVAWLF
jgi:hypothetical protein